MSASRNEHSGGARRLLLTTVIATAALGAACGDDDAMDDAMSTMPQAGQGGAGNCLDTLPLDCSIAFQPTYEGFFESQLRDTCSSGGVSCHGADGQQGGLVLSDRDEAYDYLLGEIDGRARVIPGDPECSVLMQRLESDDPEFVMPVNNPLSEAERCAVRRWIAEGAQR